ncbi:MAG: hypothetical protein ACK49R_17900 [Planctomycetota bacterium]
MFVALCCFVIAVSINLKILHGCRRDELKDCAVQWAHRAPVWSKLPHREPVTRVSEQDVGIFDGNGDAGSKSFEGKLGLLRALSISGTMSSVHLDERTKLRCIRSFELIDSRWSLKFSESIELPLILFESHYMHERQGSMPCCVLLR